jgi:hypothetical protein
VACRINGALPKTARREEDRATEALTEEQRANKYHGSVTTTIKQKNNDIKQKRGMTADQNVYCR